jgi:zinc transport system ATP-binding protein
VTIFGQKVGLYRDWNKIGYVSQQAGNINTSFPATVYEVVSSGYYSGFGRIFDGRERKRAVERALKTVDVMELSGRLIGELSGGQRQKVFLAKALVKNPEVLLLDEPTTGIDARSQEEFYRLLAKLNQRDNMTIVMVTHDLDEALEKVNKIGYIKDQKVILQIKARDFSKKDLREVFG